MPKIYSDTEREDIIRRLKKEAVSSMLEKGIKHTTVDELVRKAGIPKGTFYLFYESKELLLFTVLVEQHEIMEQRFMDMAGNIDFQSVTVDELTEVLVNVFLMIDEVPVLKVLNSDEINILAAKLPHEVIARHFEDDESMLDRMFAGIPGGKNTEAYAAAFRGIFMAVMNKEEFGDLKDNGALRLLIRGLVIQLLVEQEG